MKKAKGMPAKLGAPNLVGSAGANPPPAVKTVEKAPNRIGNLGAFAHAKKRKSRS